MLQRGASLLSLQSSKEKNMTHKLLLLLVHLLLTTVASSMSPSERASLEAIRYSLTEMPGSSFFASWDFSDSDPCSSFSGVTCSLGRVETLTLGPGISGSLSPALSNLTRLTQLILLPGLVTGPVPSELGFLPSLRVVSLTRNRLTGSIPASFSSLLDLHTLDLSYNQLSGVIPPRLTRLPHLKVLVLASNHLSGNLGPHVLSPLFHLDIKMNGVSGPLPDFLPKSLRYLSVSNNSMCGTIEVLESLTELTYLDLSVNKFTGTIPNSIFRPSVVLLLQRNNFTGMAVPTSFSFILPTGSVIDLSHNSIAGELSRELAGAETLFLNNNRLTGEVPGDYIDSLINGTTKTLYLQHNYLTRFPLQQRQGVKLLGSVSLCLSYNCLVSPFGLSSCPKDAAPLRSRPSSQCFNFFNHSSIT
ncbi:PREDICTED: probable LRR receptor-like serine/threonine-protein kinase At1g12460 [Tarenaya hassleriana]|uniref:probable LRR receptor-like serine/threonine-protein kinase At1g12460 n=1 Tax=Tarenaya hassleriana TaxID=28532 RepID=UPI00053C2A41|nr:PREDICTED: probable LRR receptor-like serine/threonine-protein kinase At1g12460 [Tarenaya hassleriana]